MENEIYTQLKELKILSEKIIIKLTNIESEILIIKDSRLTNIELEILEIKKINNICSLSLNNMDYHISFVESIYDKIKSPFQMVLNQFSSNEILPCSNKQLKIDKN